MMMMQAEFARLLDLSRNTITQWKKRGTLVLQGNLVDVEATLARIADVKRDGSSFVTLARAKLAGAVTGDSLGDRVTGEGDTVTLAGPPPDAWKVAVVAGLEVARTIPALAAELAEHHGLFDVTAFYEALVASTREAVRIVLADHEITASDIGHICDGDPFLPPAEFRRPRETEDAMWTRIFADEV